MKSDPLKEYSLWLEPVGAPYVTLKGAINQLVKLSGSTTFEPHITLLGGITDDLESIKLKARTLAEHQKPMELTVDKIGISEAYYKSIFISCKRSQEVMELNKLAQSIFHRSSDYDPHLSILYSDLRSSKKTDFISELQIQKNLPLTFLVESISVWKAFGSHDQWIRVENFCFDKDNY